MSVALTSADLVSCDRELIHTPGAIQPHGMMLVVDRGDFRLMHVAGNVEGRLAATTWQRQTLRSVIGDGLGEKIGRLNQADFVAGFMGQLWTKAGEILDVTAHLSAGNIIVELEAAAAEGLSASEVTDRLATAAASFEQSASVPALCSRAAIEFRRLTGFDRVMVYRFLADGAGEVLAEDRRSDVHSFLAHHFPAADIPVQARALYVRNVLRVIPDVSYSPVALRPAWDSIVPLDMSDSSLRSVSPIHLVYLRNMGVQASASFSIIKDGALWGLIACHHETPRILTYDIRSSCRSLVGSLGRWIKAKEEAEGYRERLRLRGFEDDLVALLSREGTLDESLSNHLDDLRKAMGSDGVVVVRGHELLRHGICPAENHILTLVKWLAQRPLELIFSTNSLRELYPLGREFEQVGSGVLAVTLSEGEPWILLWFRAEQIETIKWAGNPDKALHANELGLLTPRASFEAWSELVRGRAREWSMPELGAAIRLRSALLDVQQVRQITELNRQLTLILQDKDLLLQQKEFLITEVNHRVQNSLQLVSSFLSAQARASGDDEVQAALGEARRRLTAVALVHRRLYRGTQLEFVDAARYLEELCTDTVSFMGEEWKQHLSLTLSPMQVSTDRAIPLGLILTELLINANKYAYAGLAGPINVTLTENRTHFQLLVSDHGSGQSGSASGFGSRIMAGLVSQLAGEITYRDNRPGLQVAITLPILKP